MFTPSKIITVDDNEWLLDTLRIFIAPQRQLHTFISSFEASAYLENYANHLPKFPKNKTEVMQYLADQNRFDQVITTIMCDYDMPTESGLDFFSRVRNINLPFQKLLFSGMTDVERGKKAMLKKEIDGFLPKDELMEHTDKLLRLLASLERRYYELVNNVSHEIPLLANARYISLINQIIAAKHIVEGYLIDTVGSYLFVDAAGKLLQLQIDPDAPLEKVVENTLYTLDTLDNHTATSYSSYLESNG